MCALYFQLETAAAGKNFLRLLRTRWVCAGDVPPGKPAPLPGRTLILDTALRRLQAKVRYQPIGFELLPEKFTLTQLQKLYETVLERPLDKRNFRKKLLKLGVLEELDEIEQDVAHRAARLYRFDAPRYRKLTKRGFNFEV
jgi:hypothetical protein